MISIPQLHYIVSLDNNRNFVEAADKCFVTQPTLSMQIKKLEEDLGVVIFDRSKHPIEPTQLGKEIIQQARVVLAESERIKILIDEHQGKVEGELNVGIIPSLAPYLLPLFIGNFIDRYPKVKLNIKELLSEEIIEELHRETLDVGILVTPLSEKGIVEQPLFYEKILLYVNKEHPFSKLESIQTSKIGAKGMWMLSEGHCFRSQVLNLCSLKDKVIEEVGFKYESGSLETLKKFVEKEGGFTLVPELAVGMDSVKTKTLPIKNVPLREVSLIFTRNFSKKKLLNAFHEEICSAVPIEMKNSERGQKVQWR